jgi:hypothetical protein
VTAAIIALALLAGTLGVAVATLALKYRTDTGKLTTDLIASGKREVALQLSYDRAAFDLEVMREQTTAAQHRITVLEKGLADALSRSSLGAGLAPDDVDGRLWRAAEAGATGDPLPAVAVEPVPDAKPAATGETVAAAVHGYISELR